MLATKRRFMYVVAKSQLRTLIAVAMTLKLNFCRDIQKTPFSGWHVNTPIVSYES